MASLSLPAFLQAHNYSYYAIPVAWAIAIWPRVWSMTVYQTATKKRLDVRQPRQFAKTFADDPALDQTTRERCVRAEAAHFNSMENLSMFAAAVTAGNAAGVGNGWMNGLALGVLGIRVVYNQIYIYQDLLNSQFRSLCWVLTVACCSTMFVLAGMEMNGRAKVM